MGYGTNAVIPLRGASASDTTYPQVEITEFPIQAGDEDTSSVFPLWGVVAICSLQHRQYNTPNKENLPAISS